MGNSVANSDSIIVATLNFSGICLSPFEYHDCSVQKDFISDTFKRIMDQEIKEKDYTWKVGRIDLKLQVQRFAPVYRKDIGSDNDHLLGRQTFEKLWDEEFKKVSSALKGNQPKDQQLKSCRLFDWISYRTFVNIVYVKNTKEIIPVENYKNYDPKQYQKFMKKWHSKQYLDIAKKMKKIAKFLQKSNTDVLFLQQAEVKCELKWTEVLPNDYLIVQRQGEQSVIIYNKKTFPDQEDKAFRAKYFDTIHWNGDTVFIKRGNFLLICSHLSSKAQNADQAKLMFEQLSAVRKEYPHLQILLGLDANHFLDPNVYTQFHIYPDSEKTPTTLKKRTWVQLQTNKANVIVIQTKDHLVSTRKMKNPFIGTLDGNQISDKAYLPTDEHPFDHLVVSSELTPN